MHVSYTSNIQSNFYITVVNRIQRMIQSKVKNNILRILITYMYGAIDDLYQKIAFFFKNEIIFFSIRSIRLSTVWDVLKLYYNPSMG